MVLLSYPGSLVLILFTACLAFGAPAPANPTASPPQPPPTGSKASATPTFGYDGFQLTARYFQTFKNMAAEIESVLHTLHAETLAAVPDDKARQQADFLKKLVKQYPGATFDGTLGTIPIQKIFVAQFTSSLKVESIKEVGNITLVYQLAQGRIHLTDGTNSVTILIDQTDPTRSSFINATIPSMKESAEIILTDSDRKRIAADTVESAILNDAYQLLSQTTKTRMDIFAADVMHNPESRLKTLGIAANGYRERHPEDYQGGIDPAKTRKKKTEAAPFKPADARFNETFIKVILFIASAAGVLWAVIAGLRYLKSLSIDSSEKKKLDRYNSLSPMVTRALKKTGASLWGRNLPWSKNYYIYQRSDRWLLCDGKEDKESKMFQARTRIEVCLRSTYFKIRITRLNGGRADISLTCQDLSEWELMEGLREISFDITNAERDGSVEVAHAASTIETSPSGDNSQEIMAPNSAPHSEHSGHHAEETTESVPVSAEVATAAPLRMPRNQP